MSGELTQQELDDVRAESEKFLLDRVTIKGFMFDGVDLVPGVKAENVPCLITAGFGIFRHVFDIISDRFQGREPYVLELPWDQDIQIGDQVIGPTGTSYQVRWKGDEESFQVTIRCLGERIA